VIPLKKTAIAVVAAIGVTGCTYPISRGDVVERAGTLTKEIQEAQTVEAKRRADDERLYVRVSAPYLSGRTVALSKDARLPALFSKSAGFEKSPSTEGFTLPQVADLITKKYGIRVRVRPDVFLPASQLVPGGGSSKGDASPAFEKGPPQVVMPIPLRTGLNNPVVPALGYETRIDFDFTGSLSDYLARVSSKLGINWEWNESEQELTLFRLIRKTFVLDTSPSVVAVKSSVTKNNGTIGLQNSTSSQNSSNGSTAETSYTLNSDAWTATISTLNRMRTAAGAVEANPYTRTITMIDTRDVVTDAEKYIGQQNEILGRQVVLQMRLVRVSVEKLNQLGVSLELVLQKFSGAGTSNWQVKSTGAGSLANSAASNIAYTVINPTGAASGSSLIIDALKELGDVTDEFSQDIPVKNNRSVPISDFASFGFLERTTPGTGGGLSGGASLPGLVPGTVSSGTAVVLTPSITSGDSLSLVLSLDRSAEPTFDTISTGKGDTFQQIQIPRQRGIKFDTEVSMRNNQTLVVLGMTKEAQTNTQRIGVTSLGNAAQGKKEIQLMLITPRIVSGS
jgi:type IVB pilus formation R64 PilN family outer membrane protein